MEHISIIVQIDFNGIDLLFFWEKPVHSEGDGLATSNLLLGFG